MNRVRWLVLLIGIAVAFAQPHGEEKKEPPHGEPAAGHVAEAPAGHAPASGEGHGSAAAAPGAGMELWKWANFLLLAGGLGYLIGKNAGPFFDARTRQIRKDMDDSAAARQSAEATAADVDRRLANLETEIAALRADSKKEVEAEAARLARQAEAEIAKIQAHSEQEIVAAGKVARMDLKKYSAELAVNLAEQKIRTRMTPDVQDELVDSFVHNLK